MQPNQNTYMETSNRTAGLTALAVIGFIALVCLGMYLAVYSARFVPATVSRIGAAAVALSSVFTPSPSGLAVIPASTASTTIPFGESTSTTPVTTTTTTKHVVPQPGTETSGTYPIGTGAGATLYGLPAFTVSITATGYLTTASASSFVAASVVPAGYSPAVQFTITNTGTNVTGAWSFSATIPTQTGYTYDSVAQQSLNPGDNIAYTLGFSESEVGTSEPVTITANYNNSVATSNTANATAVTSIDVQ